MFPAQCLVMLQGLARLHPFVHHLAHRLQHRGGRLRLEDVAPHVDAQRALGDGVVRHGQRFDLVSCSPPTNTCTASAATFSRVTSSASTATTSCDSSFRMLGPPLARSTIPLVNDDGIMVRRTPRVTISASQYGRSGTMFTST